MRSGPKGARMAKIVRGRIVKVRPRFSGLAGMDSMTAEELHKWAEELEWRARYPDSQDDASWLLHRAKRLRCLAEQKEKAQKHKAAQIKVRRTKRSKTDAAGK